MRNKPIAFLTSWLPSPSSLLKLPIPFANLLHVFALNFDWFTRLSVFVVCVLLSFTMISNLDSVALFFSLAQCRPRVLALNSNWLTRLSVFAVICHSAEQYQNTESGKLCCCCCLETIDSIRPWLEASVLTTLSFLLFKFTLPHAKC